MLAAGEEEDDAAAAIVGAGDEEIVVDDNEDEDEDNGIETGAGEGVGCKAVGDVMSKPDRNASNDGFDADEFTVVGVMTGAEIGVVALAKSANKSMFADGAVRAAGCCCVGCIGCCGFDGPPKKSPNKSLTANG